MNTVKTTAKTANRFVKGQSVYKCNCCKRSTRQTGRGDNDLVGLCADCFDLAGEENYLSDTGTFHSSPHNVLCIIEALKKAGADVSNWKHLRNAAKDALIAACDPATSAPTEVKVVLHTTAGDVTTAYPMAKKIDALVQLSSYLAEGKSFTVTYE